MRIALILSFAAIACAQSTAPPTPADTEAQPEAIHTSVTVNEKIATETPASLTVLDQKDIQQTPGVNLDDRLRQVPGFSLFRRSSSLVANPTTQGVSLRAIGSTGASRTLILLDGVPLNDPFGGWVYWTRVDPAYIDRVEMLRGASTSVFGDRAMAGAVALFSPTPEGQQITASYFGGNRNTNELTGGYSNLWGKFGLSAHTRAFTTDGYYIVPSEFRGSVDDRANVRFATGDLRLDYLGTANRFSFRFDALAEERQNGTFLQNNSTGLGTIAGTYQRAWTNDIIAVRGYHTRVQYHSTFSSIDADRDFERLTSRQTVPAENVGGAAYWQHTQGIFETLVGADVDDAHGTSNDFSYSTNLLTSSGGTLLQHGVFGQVNANLGPAKFFAGVRRHVTGRNGSFWSPNGGVSVGVKSLRFRASGYRSFRAPTLNELFRDFRVGNALTKANPFLQPERLVGVEAGVDWYGKHSTVTVTLFRNDMQNLVANATLSVTPNLILRQRQNISSALSRGVEANANYRWNKFRFEAGYLYADARLSNGALIPQVPKQQGTASVLYSANRTLVSFGLRSYGLQFDDDLNQFRLPGYAALQAVVQQKLTNNLTALASMENLLDRQYLVGMTPTPTTGAPRLWRIGLRWNGFIH